MGFKVFDKYSRSELGSLELLTDSEVEKLLSKAHKSFSLLKLTSSGERANLLKNLSRLLETHSERFAGLIVAEAASLSLMLELR
jgi:acyl-CoA reductase-like NAD-dependent aldehyde dehydrogenase